MNSSRYTFWNWPWLEAARRSDAARYTFSLLCTVGAVMAWAVMDKPLNDPTPYQVLLPFVALAAWFGGAGPGILCTVTCALWAVTHSDSQLMSLHQQLELFLFFPIGGFIAALCGSLGQARQQAEEAADELTISQRHYRSIVETASEGIWMTNADLVTTFVNERMATLLGTTPEAMVGHVVADFLFEEDHDVPADHIRAHSDTGHYMAQSRYRHADGHAIWFSVNVSTLREGDGRVTGYLALHTDITQRRIQDEELQQSNERYKRATKAFTGYVYEHDLHSGETIRSSGFMDVLGYDLETTPAHDEWWRRQIHPADLLDYEKQIAIRIREGEQFSLEYRVLHADGFYRWLWDRGLVVRNLEDEATSIVGSISDISARRDAELKLRDSEANFRQLADAMPQIVWSSNPLGEPDYFNRRWYDYSGLPAGSVGLENWETFHHPDDLERVREEWELSVVNRDVYITDVRLRDAQGHYRWFLCRANPILDSNTGEILRWFGTATDIDEQRRAADAQTFLAKVGVVLGGSLDPQVILREVTRLAVPQLGDWCFVALKNSEGVPEMVVAAHRDADKVAAFWKRHSKYGFDHRATRGFPAVVRSGQPEIIEQVGSDLWQAILPDPEYRKEILEAGHRSTMIIPLEVHGQILGAIGFTYAESDRHYSETDLPLAREIAVRAAIAMENARLYRQLQDADRRKDEFLAMLAHELRNPLAAISAARSLMDELLEGEAKIITGTPRAILERQVSQLSRLVDDLLDVSRITRGKIELRRKEVDFTEVVKNAVEGVRPLILSRRHNLQLELPEGPVLVDADPARLGQVVSNLVTNAAKYTDPGGNIIVKMAVNGPEAMLRVCDNGTGLSAEMLQSIWGLFVQSDRTLERSQGGLGIGLTLVKSLTEMHGGRVGATSEGTGKGSQFFMTLPLLSPQQDSIPSALSEPKSAVGLAPVSKPIVAPDLNRADSRKSRVLVVDDNEDAAVMLCAWLESHGHDVQVAHDGSEGLVLACGWQPDVALLDIGMPGMDGYEVARKLRTLPEGRDMRLIAVTGYGQPSDKNLAMQAGFNFHLTKPVDMEELMRLIDARNDSDIA